jgi:hypothetical protein
VLAPLLPLAAALELAAGAARRGGTIAVIARRAAPQSARGNLGR